MLYLEIPESELWDENRQEFVYSKKTTLILEHSLISVSKWESKWHKSFVDSDDKTAEQTLDYIRCMTVSRSIDDNVYRLLNSADIDKVNAYINDPMTATWFNEPKGPKRKEIITSELIYYWMILYGIPFECEKWHLSRLLTLIKVCSIKNDSQKKQPKNEVLQNNAMENARRRAKLKTRG